MSEGHYHCFECQKVFPFVEGIPDFTIDIGDEFIDSISKVNILLHDSTANKYDDKYKMSSGVTGFFHKKIMREENTDIPNTRKRAGEIIKKYYDRKGPFLDMGCGTGNILRLLDPKRDQALGVDISVEMLKRARKTGFNCLRANNYRTPFKDETFAMISTFSVVHHMADLEMFFKEIFRILKKGGILYTDWDPNPIVLDLKDRHKLYKKAAALMKRSLRRDCNKHYKSSEVNIEDADYHVHHARDSGYNMDNLESIWSRIGFGKVGLYYHSNTSSIFDKRLLDENVINLLRKYILHIMDIRTSVTKCGEYMLTLLKKQETSLSE
jgi:SAM-dependent methyltransferase